MTFLAFTSSKDIIKGKLTLTYRSGNAMYAYWGEAFGSVASYRYPASGGNCIFPRLPSGGAEVVVSVMPEEVETLKGVEYFGKYLE